MLVRLDDSLWADAADVLKIEPFGSNSARVIFHLCKDHCVTPDYVSQTQEQLLERLAATVNQGLK